MNTPPTPPHVVVGDEVYYRHPEKGVLSGPVASAGKDGVRVRQGDEHHGVTWEHLLGHKTRKVRRMKIVERGEDGFLAEDEHGQREYVAGEAPEEEEAPEDKKVAPEEKPVKAEPMTKAMGQAILDAALIKAGFTPSLDYIRATYGDHWTLREDPAVDALWTALADGRARTDEALQGLRADLQKAHINAYTRSDGAFVQAHEDTRVKHDPIKSPRDNLRQLANVELPPDDAHYHYFYHAVRSGSELDAIEQEGLRPGQAGKIWMSKDEIRSRGGGFAIVRVPAGHAQEGKDVVESGLSYREFTVDQAIPAKDVLRVVREVPTGEGNHTIREDHLARHALYHPDDPDAADLPEKYRQWFRP